MDDFKWSWLNEKHHLNNKKSTFEVLSEANPLIPRFFHQVLLNQHLAHYGKQSIIFLYQRIFYLLNNHAEWVSLERIAFYQQQPSSITEGQFLKEVYINLPVIKNNKALILHF